MIPYRKADLVIILEGDMQPATNENIEYLETSDGFTPEQMEGFFVGWAKRPTSTTLLKILQASTHVAIAVHDDKVVGFATANTDGVISAYIPLIEVLPEYQGKGIGKNLMKLLLKKLENIYMIDLLCDKDVDEFYKKLGFRKTSAMMLRQSDKQSGGELL